MTDWRPDKLGKRLPNLQARARLQAARRQWFAGEGFVEVETPILQVSPGAEVHLAGFVTDWELPDGEEHVRWLHSSPEFAMKKFWPAAYQAVPVRPVFRNAEAPRCIILNSPCWNGIAPVRLLDAMRLRGAATAPA